VSLVAAITCPAQTLYPAAEAAVRDGVNFNVDINEAAQGYCMVKNGVGSSSKSYFKFNFAGQNPNTNSALSLTFTTYNNSQKQHAQVWALNQAYPGFTSSVMVWSSAQANETNTSSLLTNPTNTFTATPLYDFIAPNSANATRTVAIPAPWGSYLAGEELVLVVTSPFNGDTNNLANGLRLKTNSTLVDFQQLSGAPPSVGPISNLTVYATATSATNSFTVSDPEDGSDALYPVASSSNEAAVPAVNVFFEGSGANRTVYLLAGATPGTAQITVTVTDSLGNQGQRTFTVTVLPQNYPPEISTPAPTNTMLNTAVTIPFTVSDAETAATNLTVDGTIASYSGSILASLAFGSDTSGSNRTVTVMPAADANGVGVVTLSVADAGDITATAVFGVMVRSATNVVFNEHFDYPDGKLLVNSGSFWTRRGTTAGAVNLNTLSQQANIRPKSSADDGAAPLAGAPYGVNSGVLLYAICSATWYDAGDGALPTNSTGSFLQFLNASAATSVQAAEVGVSTNGAPDGFFNVGLIYGTNLLAPNTNVNLTLPPGIGPEPHKLITRYDLRNGTSTLWVDAASEAAPGVTVQDVTNPVSISYIGLRQDLGMGYIYVDDLQVVLVKKPVITAITPPASGNVILYFDGGPASAADFEVQGTADITASFPVIPASIQVDGAGFKATVPATGNQNFYRIKRKPVTF
jgi:hypothetical protein